MGRSTAKQSRFASADALSTALSWAKYVVDLHEEREGPQRVAAVRAPRGRERAEMRESARHGSARVYAERADAGREAMVLCVKYLQTTGQVSMEPEASKTVCGARHGAREHAHARSHARAHRNGGAQIPPARCRDCILLRVAAERARRVRAGRHANGGEAAEGGSGSPLRRVVEIEALLGGQVGPGCEAERIKGLQAPAACWRCSVGKRRQEVQ